jgi:hypothetical protein
MIQALPTPRHPAFVVVDNMRYFPDQLNVALKLRGQVTTRLYPATLDPGSFASIFVTIWLPLIGNSIRCSEPSPT